MLFAVITTIQAPTPSIASLNAALDKYGASIVVIGDKKGPLSYDLPHTNHKRSVYFFSLDQQLLLDFNIARLLPVASYARKNIGYLVAMQNGASTIYETDDDNAPMTLWSPRSELVSDLRVVDCASSRWVNVYNYFSDGHIWPRGLPLDEIRTFAPPCNPQICPLQSAPIQQGLVNGSADVDAIWRLALDKPVEFIINRSIYLSPGNWCPFNTQSTWWWPTAYPLLYIPTYCSFRMCDIWKSFVAQRCLWEISTGVVFHPAEVYQERNKHDLMSDFLDEIPGYKDNKRIAHILESLNLRSGQENIGSNFYSCYEALVSNGVFPIDEMPLIEAWLNDLSLSTS
jgi:hypothetical protein